MKDEEELRRKFNQTNDKDKRKQKIKVNLPGSRYSELKQQRVEGCLT